MLEGNQAPIEKADVWVHALFPGGMVSWQYERL